MDKNVQAALSAKIDVRGEEYTVEQALLSAHGHFAPEDLIKAILSSQKPQEDTPARKSDRIFNEMRKEDQQKGFVVTGLTTRQLVQKLIEVGHAEEARDMLLMTIGTPKGTVVIRLEEYEDACRYRAWRDSMIAHLLEEQLIIQNALPKEVGESRPPTPEEWDVAIDALRKFREAK
ncbi:hypothetical protein CPT_Summit_075 [Stenotrophomonas phage Summit]|nr:hypothetical protein CPT_Summit_075 [Stenotrophomonas phage Summit]